MAHLRMHGTDGDDIQGALSVVPSLTTGTVLKQIKELPEENTTLLLVFEDAPHMMGISPPSRRGADGMQLYS